MLCLYGMTENDSQLKYTNILNSLYLKICSDNPMTPDDIIKKLKLEPHPREGGWFRRTYTSHLTVETPDGKRQLATAIYYLLTQDQPVGFLHRNKSNIVHCHHTGAPVRYRVVKPTGEIEETLLSSEITQNHVPQLLVPGGLWKATELMDGDFALITEVVAPGFDYEDNEVATTDTFAQEFPELVETLKKTIKY